MGNRERFFSLVPSRLKFDEYPLNDTEMLDWLGENLKEVKYVDPTPTANGHYVLETFYGTTKDCSFRQMICDGKALADEVNS